jgi:mannose-6-phosphate isomerase-like protein (cupin superfamily)
MADDADIGSRLKDLREQRRLSLRALSRETGIATSFLSALEQSRNTVSVAKLKTILEALGSNLGAFFSSTNPAPTQIVYRKSELVEISGQQNGLSYKEVAAGRPGRALQLIIERYKPGADTGAELYSHNAEEAGWVLKGTIELTVGNEVFVLNAGDSYYFDSRKPHRFRNIGKTAAEAISVNTPPSF